MVYTVTFNPALDYAVWVKDFKEGLTNRSENEKIQFGGKGINVSVILSRLGIKNRALGFIAGFTGDALEASLKADGVDTDFIKLSKGLTRINVKLKAEIESEINAKGPEISEKDLDKLFSKLDMLQKGDTLVLAGSVPESIPKDIYEKILFNLQNKGIRFIVDAQGELLVNVLRYRPFLIKPNKAELEEICGFSLENDEKIIAAAKALQVKGAQNVLVSLGGEGALLLDENGKVYRKTAYKIIPVNTVGAGDSMVAGFLAGLDKGYDYAFRLSMAAGGATAACIDLATKEEIIALF